MRWEELSTAEKGRLFWEHQVRELPALEKAIKENGATRGLYQSFKYPIYRR